MNRSALLAWVFTAQFAAAADWPVWRGPTGDGIINDPAVPEVWTATENVRWKVPVPGVGHSSPVVVAGRVFLTSYDADTDARMLLCLDRESGRTLWAKTVLTAAREGLHPNNTPASSTPAADGSHVWSAFLDGENVAVACHTHDGDRVWLRRFPGFDSRHGFCGTPVLFEGLVIVNGDSDGEAFLAAVDRRTGDPAWKVPRPNRVRSFSVPLFITVDGRTQMVLAGSKSIAAFDPATGRQIWVVDSPTLKFVATVAYTDGVVFATGTSPKQTLTAIDPTGTGNVTETHVLWSDHRGAAYVPSPLGFKGRFFVLADDGTASLREARTGNVLWSERLGSRLHHASPLLLNGAIYCLADDGTTHVLSAGDEFEKVRENRLGEACHATPAVSAGELFVRSVGHLWCIGRRTGSP